MRRARRSLLLLALLLSFGLVACGGDDGGDDSSSDAGSAEEGDSSDSEDSSEPADEPADEGEPSDEGGSGGEGVEAYCDAVDEYVELVQDALNDPSGAGTELTEAAEDLAEQAGTLGLDLSPEDADRLQECSQEATEALTGG
jgi:hypothetical protein